MRFHERNEMHRDLDEYEEEEEDLEEEGMEYFEDGDEEEEEDDREEEHEKEDPKPTKEELEYLELRQRLKEEARRRLKKESASTSGHSQERKKLPYDNYGSFFGPSQPVIARRVLEESKSILETQHIHARTPNSNTGSKKGTLSTNGEKRDRERRPPPKAVNELKMKVQKLRDTRDYSFLMSDDAEFPVPSKECAPRNVPVRTSDARPAQATLKGKESSMSKTVKPAAGGHEERKLVSASCQMPTKVVHPKAAPTIRPGRPLGDPRKLLGSNVGNGPGRPVAPKVPFPGSSANNMEKKKAALVSAKSSVPVTNRAPLPRLQAATQKDYLEKKKDNRLADKPKMIPRQPVDKPKVIPRQPENKPKLMPKKPVPSSKPQMKPLKQMPARPMREDRPKKRPVNRYSDEEDMDDGEEAINMIRSMFGYNPKKYADVDDDVSDMEANFDDILEEERRSAKIAKEEDEREQRLIEEEERRERMRREAKKRKLR
eukprot:TRINITY_DN3108_c0_g2_i9.p1 TRINITY_DN3108_c0_g2~~TRINITY_DN3108_c0_g2_i9.p1  ORF type:complete len:487 (+),score=136.46 TRINITY_DN3108_c0_g2_i9:164-1624(+)